LAVRTVTDSRCRSERYNLLTGLPVLDAASFEICFSTADAAGAQAPLVSHTIGRKVTPCSAHEAAVFKWARLISEYEVAACRASLAAVPAKSAWFGEVIAKSRAAGRPPYHWGK
jgi:hypothetical protein